MQKKILCVLLAIAVLAALAAGCAVTEPAVSDTQPTVSEEVETPAAEEAGTPAPEDAAEATPAPEDTEAADDADLQDETAFIAEEATKEEVENYIQDSDETTVLVDARVQEAYSGWALEGAANGGHLENAILYSARWLDFAMDEEDRAEDLAEYNEKIGLSADNSYIIYDYDGNKNAAENVANYFAAQGIKNVKVFNAKEMIDAGENVVQYANYDMFIPAEIVKAVSDYKSGATDTLNTSVTQAAGITEDNIDSVVLIDVTYGNVHESTYLSDGHVPGAVHINTNAYERPRSYTPEKREQYSVEYSLITVEEFRDSVCPEYGITKDSIVIATSTDVRPLARFGFMLRSLGVKYYAMSANMNAWIYNGYRLDTENIEKPVSVESFGSSEIPYPDEIVWMDQVKRILSGEEAGTLIGGDDFSTYGYHDLMGRIPGAVDAEEYAQNIDGTSAMPELLLQGYIDAGVPTDELIVPFCGDGWGAARTAYHAQAVGLENVKYWGEGWVVWSNRGNEFETYDGRLVHYDKYLDAVVDSDGNIIVDENVMKIE